MEKKLLAIKLAKGFFYLIGFPLLILLCLIKAMPMFDEPVFEGYASNGILLVLAMWAICEAVRLTLKLTIKKKGTLRSLIVALLAMIIMFVPVFTYDSAQSDKVDEIRAAYSEKAVGGKTITVKSYDYQAGWVLGATSKGDNLIDDLLADAEDCSRFYYDVLEGKYYQLGKSVAMEDNYFGNAGFPEATEKQLAAGKNLYYYDTGASIDGTSDDIGYIKYDAETTDAKKCVFYIEIEDKADYKPTDEQLDIGNKRKPVIFTYDKENDSYLVASDTSDKSETYYYFLPKYFSTDIWGYEVYMGKQYGLPTILNREIELLEGYVKSYDAAVAAGSTPVAGSAVYDNYQIAVSGNDSHCSLLSLYDLEARLSYQPAMYPILTSRYFIYIFIGIVALSYILVGYYEEKEYAIKARI